MEPCPRRTAARDLDRTCGERLHGVTAAPLGMNDQHLLDDLSLMRLRRSRAWRDKPSRVAAHGRLYCLAHRCDDRTLASWAS